MSARRAVFEAVRIARDGRGFNTAEIAVLDRALDELGVSREAEAAKPAAPPVSEGPLHLGPAGIALIQGFEGCARIRADGLVQAYPDPGTGGHPWTIGWGTTGPDVQRGTVWTRAQCDARFAAHVEQFAAEVRRAIGTAPTTQHQFDALVSFHYNTGAIAKASLTRLHKAGDHAGAAREFAKWVNAGGRRMAGLVRRRAAEAALYKGN